MHHHKTQVHTQLSCDSNPHGVKKKVRLGKKTKNKPWMPNHICYHVLGTSHLSYPHLPTCQVPPAVSHATSHMQSTGTLIWRCQWCSLVSELKLWSEEQHPTAKGRFKGEVKLKARNRPDGLSFKMPGDPYYLTTSSLVDGFLTFLCKHPWQFAPTPTSPGKTLSIFFCFHLKLFFKW